MIKIDDLINATIAITRRCNLRCKWCFESSAFNYKDLPKIQILNILRKLKKVRSINFTGGEPFMRDDFISILKSAIKTFEDVNITTNGLLINEDYLRFYAKNKIHFGISLDGPKQIHEKIRGKGTFNLIIKKIKLLRKNDIYVNIQTTISKENKEYIPYLIRLARRLGVNRISFMRLRPFGRGESYKNLLLTAEENYNIAKFIYETNKKESFHIMYKDPLINTINTKIIKLSKSFKQENKIFVCGGCRAAFESIFIHYNGDVFPCPYLQIPLGNLLKEPLEKIWLNSCLLNKFRKKENYLKCGNCKFWGICRGCRASALGAGNGLMGIDPGCWN